MKCFWCIIVLQNVRFNKCLLRARQCLCDLPKEKKRVGLGEVRRLEVLGVAAALMVDLFSSARHLLTFLLSVLRTCACVITELYTCWPLGAVLSTAQQWKLNAFETWNNKLQNKRLSHPGIYSNNLTSMSQQMGSKLWSVWLLAPSRGSLSQDT